MYRACYSAMTSSGHWVFALKPEFFTGVDDDRACSEFTGLRDHIRCTTRTIAAAAVPKRNQRSVAASTVERVMQHSEIVTLPDAVVLFGLKPNRHFLAVAERLPESLLRLLFLFRL